MVQVAHPYMTTGKAIASIIRIFAGKVISLLFNMLPRFVIAFLPRIKHLLISWLQSPPAVILEPKKIKSVPVSIKQGSRHQRIDAFVVLERIFESPLECKEIKAVNPKGNQP